MRFRTIILILVVLLVAGVSAILLTSGSHLLESAGLKGKSHPPHVMLEDTIFNVLRRMEIPDSAVSVHATKSTVEIHASIPRGEPVEVVIDRISAACAGTSYHIDDCVCPAQGKYCAMRYLCSTATEPVVNLILLHSDRYFSKAARMMIVLTDFASARSDVAEEFLDFPAPLAFAIVPTSSSAKLAQRVRKQKNMTIVTLLPMEPARNIRDEYRKARIMIDFPEKRLRSLVHAAFEKVPGSTGAINLGGSKALEDSRVMEILFSEAKNRHAFFIEQTSPRKSVAADLAQKLAVPFAQANRYIDSSATESQVMEQLARYAGEAQAKGSVIVVAAATENLLNALRRDLPDLKRNGISLSHLSELFDDAKDEE